MEKNRSEGLTIFVILDLILAFTSLYSFYKYFVGSGNDIEAQQLGILFLLAGIFLIVRAILTFMLKSVARILHIGLSILTVFILWALLGPVIPKIGLLAQIVFYYLFLVIVSILIIIYFTRPKVKEQFK